MSETGSSNVTVRGFALCLNEEEMKQLHWALYQTYGNDLPWWGKVEATCRDQWSAIVADSYRAARRVPRPEFDDSEGEA